ncbi:DUF1799 domain-containing protein [Sphingomonas paucimobilis]|uniref:DNA, contig: SP630 n=1 Tax=Sphingomonas paucimobilis NBRC 13935 TaxID=1219050 RepID=A0A0C9N3H1_SPHPI|nr:DUF1799 domain-containing protein [Sphingomonas paucimobilis]GAN14154.1 hypothetical protein SP6_30_02950 [Sphingomonas paucimobilis NBRC 13935]SUJ08083.1 Uncharacterised protein [Sphingomonas paucimobilis]
MEIGPDEVDVVTLFMALTSQWRFHAMGGRLGIEYAAVRPTADMLEIVMTTSLFLDLQMMERAALVALA